MVEVNREVGVQEVEELLRARRPPKAARPGKATLAVAAIALLLAAVMQEDAVVDAEEEEVGVEVVRHKSSPPEPQSGWTADYRMPMPSSPRSAVLE